MNISMRSSFAPSIQLLKGYTNHYLLLDMTKNLIQLVSIISMSFSLDLNKMKCRDIIWGGGRGEPEFEFLNLKNNIFLCFCTHFFFFIFCPSLGSRSTFASPWKKLKWRPWWSGKGICVYYILSRNERGGYSVFDTNQDLILMKNLPPKIFFCFL